MNVKIDLNRDLVSLMTAYHAFFFVNTNSLSVLFDLFEIQGRLKTLHADSAINVWSTGIFDIVKHHA